MPSRQFPNHLRSARKHSGLSQEEVAFLLGGHNGGKVSRYEQFNRMPALETACAYEALFGIPVSRLFAGIFEKACRKLAKRAQLLANELDSGAPDVITARKLAMLANHRIAGGQTRPG